ncbi:hypothetical protein N8T08_004197 [Aspergillus melleus]|uniref:Uncharacterized protein n=1 Tax=Aspergillus melleus TaxID=138277 RepID=A0ACC3B5Z5_9EURO|nr:hypothetical protein N8T08_004197 [Aspergillus melleus]
MSDIVPTHFSEVLSDEVSDRISWELPSLSEKQLQHRGMLDTNEKSVEKVTDGAPDTNGNNNETPGVLPDSTQGTPINDGKLLLTVIKYDSGTAKLLPGGRLAPTPSQLATSKLGIIRAHLLKDGYLEKDDGNKPFCTKDGIEVTDDITFDHYVEENSEANTPAANPPEAAAAPTTATTNEGGKSTKHNIYILTKKRDAKKLDPNIDAFFRKPLDLSNKSKVDFATASTGAPLASSFNSSSWAAEASGSIVHPADMTEKEWGIVMRNNSLLSGQFLQKGPVKKIIKVPGHDDITRPGIEVTNVEKAYYSAFALKPRRLPVYDITFTITETAAKQMDELKIEPPDDFFRIPRFHIEDASQVRVFETKGSLETAMAKSSFSENSIDVAVSGSAFGISAAGKGGANWNKDGKSASSRFNDTAYMHVVYEFPRVELILKEENLELSDECQADIRNLRHRRTLKELEHFEKRYGTFFTRSVHLGGKLVSIDESDSVAGANTSEKTKMLKAAAGASVAGPPKWCPTVTSFYNWRVMKQDDVVNIYELIGKLPGYEDIPSLVENILHINPDPKSLVQFSLHMLPYAKEDGSDRDRKELHFGQPKDEGIAQLNMDPALTDPHSLQPHQKECVSGLIFGQPKPTDTAQLDKDPALTDPHSLQPHQKERISELGFVKQNDQYRPYGTAFGVPVSADQSNIDLEESTESNEADILYPRVKYGVKYPLHYIVHEEEWDEKITSSYALQIGGDISSSPFLYGEHGKAANVMVEFSGGKKNTLVKDYVKLELHLSYLLQDATIPSVSNFRFKDIYNMEQPDLEKVKQKVMKDLLLEPKAPLPPQLPKYPSYEGHGRLDAPYMDSHTKKLFDQAKTREDKLYIATAAWRREVNRLKADYEKEREKYISDNREYHRKLQGILEEVGQTAEKGYEHLKKEWDEHQRVMNESVPFEKMVFKIDYCNLSNKANYVAQKKAAKAALEAEKRAKEKELGEELAKEADEQAKEAKAAAIKKDHDEKLNKRREFLLRIIEQMSFWWRVDNWLVMKSKLERVKCSMEQTKADRLGADIKKKDDAITSLAEYDLDLDEGGAFSNLRENPFWKDATAEVKIPV